MKRKMNKYKLFMVVCIGLILSTIIINQIFFNFNDAEYIITITDKERVYDKDSSSSKYLVFGDDENGNSLVFENTDCIIRGKWNSSNIQGQFVKGNMYKITVVGYRIPFFNMYQNIIDLKKLKSNEKI